MKDKKNYAFVLDCSTTMAWLFEDEMNEQSDEILDKLENMQAIVPSIWSLEVANVLLVAQRKKRVTPVQVASFMDAVALLPIHVEDSSKERTMGTIFTLALQENLTIYDAAYLELSIREKIPIATQDRDLIKAARELKITVL